MDLTALIPQQEQQQQQQKQQQHQHHHKMCLSEWLQVKPLQTR
jgi:hypothetical protein